MFLKVFLSDINSLFFQTGKKVIFIQSENTFLHSLFLCKKIISTPVIFSLLIISNSKTEQLIIPLCFLPVDLAIKIELLNLFCIY